MNNILDCFPLSEPRPSQITALNWLIEQDATYLLLQAPVGSGKSATGITYSKYLRQPLGSSYILTPQRILQEQYEKSFDEESLASLYGKSNYICREKNTTCDIGSVFVKNKCSSCPYKNALARAKDTSNLVFNYKLALLMFGYTDLFRGESQFRELMILDECHVLEEQLTDFGAPAIYQNKVEKFGIKWPDMKKMDLLHALLWLLDEYIPAAKKFLLRLQHRAEPLLQDESDRLTKEEMKLVREYLKLKEHISEYKKFASQDPEVVADNYVLIYDITKKNSFRFKQITGARNFRWILQPHAKRFLFMSSTILNKEGFCDDLGLPPNDTAFLSLNSEFPTKNRQVFFIPHTKMTANWNVPERAKDREHMLNGVKKLLFYHEDENGIIHTGNFKIAEWLIEELNRWPQATHEFIHHNPDTNDDRNSIIRHFQSNTVPSVLISPSITEGLDLYDDLARFAIIIKVPFGYLGDQWIKRRLIMSQEWYNRQAVIDIIQGGGRIVRSNTDWGNVYILDESWDRLYNVMWESIPKWWRNAYTKL